MPKTNLFLLLHKVHMVHEFTIQEIPGQVIRNPVIRVLRYAEI